MTSPTAEHDHTHTDQGGYRHAALLYAGRDDFVRRMVTFVADGVARDEPVLVVVDREKIDLIRAELNGAAEGVVFADMADVGANPARIIPVWEEFVESHPGRSLRGVGEPIFPERTPHELVECQHHERLLNVALAESDLFLVCPYDTEAMPAEVIAEARRSHPILDEGGTVRPSGDYDRLVAARGLLDDPLPDPPAEAETFEFQDGALPALRTVVRERAERAGMTPERTWDLVLAVGEVATNSLRHGGGGGTLRTWLEHPDVVCDIRDGGRVEDPLIDRRRPRSEQLGGWGLWLANQVCDLVQLRSDDQGTVARVRMRIS